MTPKEIEKIDACMEHVRSTTERVIERETSAHDVLAKVSGKMLQLVANYKMRGQVPHYADVEDCAAMLCAIAVSCMPDHETVSPEKEDAPKLAHRFG